MNTAAAVERARLAAAAADERLADDLNAELIGRIRTTPTAGHSAGEDRRVGEWARQHHPEPEPVERAGVLDAIAALNPTCLAEWEVSRACAGVEVADGFDLEAHVKRIAAVVAHARRLS